MLIYCEAYLFFYETVCYNKIAALSTQSTLRWEVIPMTTISSFVLSVVAGVVSNYICKWLDKQHKDSKH